MGLFFSRVRHRGVPDRERVPDRCNAVDVCSDVPAWAQRAERAADGGVVDVSLARSGAPCAPGIHAPRVARFHPLVYPQLLATKAMTSRPTVGLNPRMSIEGDTGAKRTLITLI